MPRRARMYLAGLPYHIVQRGNNREACFFDEGCYRKYLELLKEYSCRYLVSVHAYVLMTNHVHLLLTPEKQGGDVSKMMQMLSGRFAFYMNKQYRRTGTIWEGRHKASVVQSERYVLACYRYIELNPVRANMVASPEEYIWSSYVYNGWGDDSGWLTQHQEYTRLGKDRESRCRSYRELFNQGLAERDLIHIRRSSHYCMPLGDDRFAEQIEQKVGRKLGYAGLGRPKLNSELI